MTTKQSLKELDKAIRDAEPQNYEQLINTVSPHIRNTWGWSTVNVNFHGYYQGIRLFVSTSKKTYSLPNETEIYVMPKQDFLPNITQY